MSDLILLVKRNDDVLCKFEVLAVFIRFCVETINNEANDLLIQQSVLFASKM